MTPAPLRVAIVGAGLMGRWHASAAVRAGAIVTSVVDPDAGRARRLARRFRATVTEPSALRRDTVDIAHVCTPLSTHAPVTLDLLRAGVSALVEKPLARDATETEDLLAEADRQGVVVCPVHQFPFQTGAQRALGALARLGPLLHIDYVACSAGGVGRAPDDLAGIVADILPHPLSLLHRVLPSSMDALQWSVLAPAEGEFRATAEAHGATVALLVSMGGRPTRNTLRLVGTLGTAHLDLFHGFATVERGAVSRGHKLARPFRYAGATLATAAVNLSGRVMRWETAYPGLRALVRSLYAAVRAKAPPPIGADEIRGVALARDRLLAASGR